MLVGNLVSILSGGTITVVISLIRGRDQPSDVVWENTRDIDNPLRPWSDFYVRSPLCVHDRDVTESVATTRSPFCG